MLVAVLSGALATEAFAQEAASPRLKVPELSGYAEVVVADRYIYHGFVAEDKGPIVQPYFEVNAEFYEGSGLLDSASLTLAVFSSLQFHDQGLSNKKQPMRSWYEAQFEPGISFVLAKDFTFTAKYIRFESPNGAFVSANAVQLELEIDDTRWLRAFALHPSFTWFAPLAIGSEQGSEEGHYFEIGVTPTATLAEKSSYPVTVSLPIVVGLGDQHYFFGQHFGFFSAGVTASTPLAFIPKGFGTWNLGASATYYRLGRTSAEFTNRGERNESVLAATVSTEF